jgi:Uncharacterized protein conserved in bacteria (DUF2147)
MRQKFLTVIAAGLMAALAYAGPLRAAEPSAAGMWAQVDEHGQVGGWFLIFEHNGVYEGAIAKMFFKPGEDPHPICTHCKGDQKDAPSLGLTIIKGMQRNGLVYQNGNILDPRDGQVYHAKMTLSPDGQQLTLRGYLGFELFGQSQVWKRLPDDVLPADEMPPNLVPYWTTLPKPPHGIMTKDGGPAPSGSPMTSQPGR